MSEQKCEFPPEGWFCTREKGHEGPCAALPIKRLNDRDQEINRFLSDLTNPEVSTIWLNTVVRPAVERLLRGEYKSPIRDMDIRTWSNFATGGKD